jgi:GTP-binding protein
MSFTLAIVGRPNVGKSTLFNRLAGKKLAIVDDTPGVTRDWRETSGHLFDLPMRIIDTAGLEEAFDDSIEGRMRRQTEAALKEADAILFIIDGRAGVTPLDEHFASYLRRRKKPIILGVNKCENPRATQSGLGEAYALGLGEPIAFSAEHGTGMEELYHAVMEHVPEESQTEENDSEEEDLLSHNLDEIEGNEDFEFEQEEEDPEKPLKVAIVGRPNVGKSTLLNAIVKHERVMTGPEAGITRDAIAVEWSYNGRPFRLVDTAGMRRKSKVMDSIEIMSVEDAMRQVRLAQIVILVLDGNAALEKQDLQIAEHIINEGRALVIAVNKWDTIQDRDETRANIMHKMSHSLSQIRDIPTVTISALHGKNIEKLLDRALENYAIWNKRVKTGKLNRWLSGMESQNPAPLVGGRQNRLKYMAQIKTRPPTFALWVSQPKELPPSYKRYITNGLRRDFDMPGVPIRLLTRASKNPFSS